MKLHPSLTTDYPDGTPFWFLAPQLIAEKLTMPLSRHVQRITESVPEPRLSAHLAAMRPIKNVRAYRYIIAERERGIARARNTYTPLRSQCTTAQKANDGERVKQLAVLMDQASAQAQAADDYATLQLVKLCRAEYPDAPAFDTRGLILP